MLSLSLFLSVFLSLSLTLSPALPLSVRAESTTHGRGRTRSALWTSSLPGHLGCRTRWRIALTFPSVHASLPHPDRRQLSRPPLPAHLLVVHRSLFPTMHRIHRRRRVRIGRGWARAAAAARTEARSAITISRTGGGGMRGRRSYWLGPDGICMTCGTGGGAAMYK